MTSPAPEVLGEGARATSSARRARSSLAGKTAIVAVNPCRKLRPPTGPISPAQKKPPAGAPSASSIASASWSATSNMCEPRPLQVNSSAPAAPGGPERRGLTPERVAQVLVGGGARRARASAPSGRPGPARRRDRLRVAGRRRRSAGRGSRRARTTAGSRRSRGRASGRCAASACSRGSRPAIASRRRSIAGLEASSAITLPSAAVIVISGPIGRRALRDARAGPRRRRASRRPRRRRARRRRETARRSRPAAALARPPSTGIPGRSSFSRSSSASALNV